MPSDATEPKSVNYGYTRLATLLILTVIYLNADMPPPSPPKVATLRAEVLAHVDKNIDKHGNKNEDKRADKNIDKNGNKKPKPPLHTRLEASIKRSNEKIAKGWDKMVDDIKVHQIALKERHDSLEDAMDALDAKEGGKGSPKARPSLDMYEVYYADAQDSKDALKPPVMPYLAGIDGLKAPDFETYHEGVALPMYSKSHLPLLARRLHIPPSLLPPPFGFVLIANGFTETSRIKKLMVKGKAQAHIPSSTINIQMGPVQLPIPLPAGDIDLNLDKVTINTHTSRVKVQNRFLGGQFDVDILPFMGLNLMGGYVENYVTTTINGARFTVSGHGGAVGNAQFTGAMYDTISKALQHPGGMMDIMLNGMSLATMPNPFISGSVTCIDQGTSLTGDITCQSIGVHGVTVGLDGTPLVIKNDTRGYIIGGGPNFKFGYKGFFAMLNLMMLYINLDKFEEGHKAISGFISKPVFVYYPRIGYRYSHFTIYFGAYGYKLVGTTKGKGNPLPPAIAKLVQLDSFGTVLDNTPISYTLGGSIAITRNYFISGEYQASPTKQGWNLAIGARF